MTGERKSTVLLCNCGEQLKLDFGMLQKELGKLDLVSTIQVHDSVCQETGLEQVASLLQKNDNPLVIAACTNQKIQPRIKSFLQGKNINPSRITYINIREHSAWVHDDISESSDKSLDMIRGGVAIAAQSSPLPVEKKTIKKHVTVIGGGIAGIESALNISNFGYDVTLIEVESELGGHLRKLPVVAPSGRAGNEIIEMKTKAISNNPRITVMSDTKVRFFEGEMGDFTVNYHTKENTEDSFKTSAVVLATGFHEFKPTMIEEYRYGKNPDVVTQLELSTMITEGNLTRPSDGGAIKDVMMIQCVGSRSEDYKRDCSKLCCTFAIDNAIEILKHNPEAQVRIVYMDIRVPFENEMIYKESRDLGVDYIRGRVSLVWENNGVTHVKFYDSLLNQYYEVETDLLVLSSAILPSSDLSQYSESLGFLLEDDGHVKELYGKLRRNETRRRGVMAVGTATRPQFVREIITEAQATALVLHSELQGGEIESIARGAVLDIEECVGCSLCAQQCPRGVPLMIEQTEEEETSEDQKILFKATIDTLNCHACGVCQSLCPTAATQLNFLTNEQLWSQIYAVLKDAGPDYPITLCFYCEECAVSTIDIVGTRRMHYPANTRLIPVPCAGRVSIIDILKAFEHGASTVMIAACETDRCHVGGTGNEIAQVQVDVAREILNAIGWDGKRVEMFRMFSAEPNRFISAVNEMTKRANELGPTPVHKGTAGKWMEVSK